MKFTTTLLGFLAIAFGNTSPLNTYEYQACPVGCCGVQGFESPYADPFYVNDDPSLCSEDACAEVCAAFEECQTYALGWGTCRLYNQPENEVVENLPYGPFYFYSACCSPYNYWQYSGSDNYEPDYYGPDNYGSDNCEPDNCEPDNCEPDNYEPDNYGPDNYEPPNFHYPIPPYSNPNYSNPNYSNPNYSNPNYSGSDTDEPIYCPIEIDGRCYNIDQTEIITVI